MTDCTGTSYEMPVLLEWDISYGDGLPCDAFEVKYIYEPQMLAALSGAVRFAAMHEGKTVFTGVVDEFDISCTDEGRTVSVSGRSMAALLLDNEAEAAEYWSVGLQSILDTYAYGCGIEKVRINEQTPNQALTVASGASCWRALEDFLWYGARLRPKFAQDGTLVIGKEKGQRLIIDGTRAVSASRYRCRRYGVISEVLVKNKSAGAASTVVNESFKNSGGRCRRVVNVPRKTRYDAMRATGEYQIEGSKREQMTITVTVPELFAAFPGDTVQLQCEQLGLCGVYSVGGARCFATENDAGTEIILTEGEA